MARPQAITDDEVLAAARVVFLAKGISATVEEVAERCHVGVATIFRRFPTKAELFSAAMTVANDAEWNRFLAYREALGERLDARQGLLELANTMLDTARKMVPLFMMKMSNPSVADRQSGAQRATWILGAVTDYFQKEIERGRLIDVDPRVAARIWLGAIRHIVMFERLGPPSDDLSNEDFIAALADLFCPPRPRKKKS
ncbi:MAG TPA: helix-turn-helix domain-containing protein [Polyangiaceae bacterium]|jgi:AcrR family transcriptional regulator|nr:helix-turn-helix domain-containing protein [Polyangiaceae bacterium]